MVVRVNGGFLKKSLRDPFLKETSTTSKGIVSEIPIAVIQSKVLCLLQPPVEHPPFEPHPPTLSFPVEQEHPEQAINIYLVLRFVNE